MVPLQHWIAIILGMVFHTSFKPKKVKQPWETEGLFQRYLSVHVFLIKTFVTLNLKGEFLIWKIITIICKLWFITVVKFHPQHYYSKVAYLLRNKFQYILCRGIKSLWSCLKMFLLCFVYTAFCTILQNWHPFSIPLKNFSLYVFTYSLVGVVEYCMSKDWEDSCRSEINNL